MKKSALAFLLLLYAGLGYCQMTIVLTDSAFCRYLKMELPQVLEGTNKLMVSKAALVKSLNCSNREIYSLEGIQYFTGLTTLNASNNNIKTLPDLSTLVGLEVINVNRNEINIFPLLAGLQNLQMADFSNNRLRNLPELTNLNLVVLDISDNRIQQLATFNNLKQLKVLNASNNEIAAFSDLNRLVNLEQLNLHNNQLEQLPAFSNLSKLMYLNAEANKITNLPDLSLNSSLVEVDFDWNYLTDVTNLLKVPTLRKARVENNYLTFADFINIAAYSNAHDIFRYSDQRYFEGEALTVQEGEPILLQTNIDAGTEGITYEWYFNDRWYKLLNTDSLYIPSSSLKDEGKYNCRVRHTDFPGNSLRTHYFIVKVLPCKEVPQVSPKIVPSNCLYGGEIVVDTNIFSPGSYTYSITEAKANKIIVSITGRFSNLSYRDYTLTVVSKYCLKQNVQEIHIPSEECKEAFITPNGDEDHDAFYFSQAGKVAIFDKAGKCVINLVAPVAWQGKDENGKSVPLGYYIAEINNGQEYIMLSVIY